MWSGSYCSSRRQKQVWGGKHPPFASFDLRPHRPPSFTFTWWGGLVWCTCSLPSSDFSRTESEAEALNAAFDNERMNSAGLLSVGHKIRFARCVAWRGHEERASERETTHGGHGVHSSRCLARTSERLQHVPRKSKSKGDVAAANTHES